MYQAIPYSASRPWPQPPMAAAEASAVVAEDQRQASEIRRSGEEVRRAVAECPVLVVGRRGCCLSHVVKRLLQGLGVNPAVHEVAGEAELAGAVGGGDVALPAVFVGGKLSERNIRRVTTATCLVSHLRGAREPRVRRETEIREIDPDINMFDK